MLLLPSTRLQSYRDPLGLALVSSKKKKKKKPQDKDEGRKTSSRSYEKKEMRLIQIKDRQKDHLVSLMSTVSTTTMMVRKEIVLSSSTLVKYVT